MNATPTLTPEQAIELVRQMPVECREAVFREMLREVSDSQQVLSPPVLIKPVKPLMTEEQLAEVRGRLGKLNEAIPMSQFIEQLRKEPLLPPQRQ